MSVPAQRNDVPTTTRGGATPAVTIEQLLLTGLDHYVRGQFERAVDVWTRVLFLDRNHTGARSYIRSARAAMAERHRESDALLHAGVEACDRGEATEARALLTKAIQHGGANDEILAALDRVERLGDMPAAVVGESVRPRDRSQRRRREPDRAPGPRAKRPSTLGLAAVVLVVAAAGLIVTGLWMPIDLSPAGSGFLSDVRPFAGPVAPLLVPSEPALALGRARLLAGERRLSEALGMLNTVGSGDGLHQEVEALRGQLQRTLLERLRLAELEGERVSDVLRVARPAF
jgi:hypothetical protein